jgi:hypothetical protein
MGKPMPWIDMPTVHNPVTGKRTQEDHRQINPPNDVNHYSERITEKFDDDGDTILEKTIEKDVTWIGNIQSAGKRDVYKYKQNVNGAGKELTKHLQKITYSEWDNPKGKYIPQSVETVKTWFPSGKADTGVTQKANENGDPVGPESPVHNFSQK